MSFMSAKHCRAASAAALIFGLVGGLASCGGGEDPSTEAIDRLPKNQKIGTYPVFVKSGALSFEPGSVFGNGTVLIANTLQNDSQNLELSFALMSGGTLELVGYSNPRVQGGLRLQFTREGSGPGSLKAKWRGRGKSHDLSSQLQNIDASSILVFSVDLHNNTPHITIWKGPRKTAMPSNKLLRTDENSFQLSSGTGASVGLRLEGATVFDLKISSAVETHL